MMLRWFCKFQVWMNRQEGTSTAEYLVLALVIVVGLVATLKSVRQALIDQFATLINGIKAVQ